MRSNSKYVIVVVAFAVGGLLAGFVARGSANAHPAASSSTPAAAVVVPTTTVPVPVVNAGQATALPRTTTSLPAHPSSGGQSGGTATGGGTATNNHPSAPAPVINTFVTRDNIDCHNGNFQNFSASWTTTHAVKTTISIDGAGIYNTYAANADTSLPFNCSSPHTFLLTAYGSDGKTVSRSITLQPRNVQPPSNSGDDL